MNALRSDLSSRVERAEGDEINSPCITCTVRASNFCGTLLEDGRPESAPCRFPLHQRHQSAHARQILHRMGEAFEDVLVICEGWAFRFVRLADGRRQILSFLLPGDFITGILLFRESLTFSVQALTELRYAKFNRSEMKAKLVAEPQVFSSWIKLCIQERERADRVIVSLGQRQADERIARLILLLMKRLAVRGMANGPAFGFPLRQQHIADAVGLTTVHVSRVMGDFRKSGLVEIEGGVLNVLNLAKLRRIAERSGQR